MGLCAVRWRCAIDVDGCCGSGTRDRQLGSQELLSLLSSLLQRQEVRLALIGSAHGDDGPLARVLLLHAGGMLELIELDTRFDRDLIGDSEAADRGRDSVSIGLWAHGTTVAVVGLSLSAKFFTKLWILSISCLVRVCASLTCSTMERLVEAALSAAVTLRKPIGIDVLLWLREDEAWIKLVPAPLDAPEEAVMVRVLWVFERVPLCEDGFKVLSCSWISIIWSPRRTLRLSGDLPLRKSFT